MNAAKTTQDSNGNTFNVGDGVSWSAGTDTNAGTIVRISGKSIFVVEDEAKLVNGPKSGEKDALTCETGGFAAHWEGYDRYEYSPGSGSEIRFTFRKTGRFKEAGTSINGSMRGWGNLSTGRNKRYDRNF